LGCGNPLGTGYPNLASQVAYTPTGLQIEAETAEARLASNAPDSRISWVAGVYWERRQQRDFQQNYDTYAYPQYFGMAPPCIALSCALIRDEHELFVDEQSAIFAQADIRIVDELTATLGLRVAHVTVNGANTTSIGALIGAPPWAGFSSSNNPVTPRLGLTYKLNHDNLLYASF